MTDTLENNDLISSRIHTVVISHGFDESYVAGVFTDENLAQSYCAELAQRLEGEDTAHSNYPFSRISVRLVSHPVYDTVPKSYILHIVTMVRNPSDLQEWVPLMARREIHTMTSLLDCAQTNAALAQLIANPAMAFRDESISNDEMQEFLTFDPDNIVLSVGNTEDN